MFDLIFSFLAAIPWLIALGLAIIAYRYYRAAKAGNLKPPLTINPGAALKAIQIAIAGNPAAAFEAITASFHLDVAAGSIEHKLLDAGFAELERRAKDPNAKLPIMDYIAHFTGIPRDAVIKTFEAEYANQDSVTTITPAITPATPSPAIAAVATAIILLFCSLGNAADQFGRLSHWYADVKAPQSFNPTEPNLFAPMRSKAASDCDLPPSKPNVFVNYFYADWCADCRKATSLTDSLERQGYDIIKRDCTKDTGMARVFDVKSVPFWIVHVDGRTTLKTSDASKLTDHLRQYPPRKQQWHPTAIGIDGISTPKSDAIACVNALRDRNGLGPLIESASLSTAAINQANWLAYYGYEGHNGDGHTFGNGSSQQRAYAAGFRGTIEAPNPGNTNNFVGECIRCSWNETGAQVIEGWRTSTGGHWKALIAPSFNVCGFGCAKSRQGRDIWVGMFGRSDPDRDFSSCSIGTACDPDGPECGTLPQTCYAAPPPTYQYRRSGLLGFFGGWFSRRC